jgi:hypothetical protein
MPFFQLRARSWEAYVAGIGASGALLAGGIAIFVILIGVVTFKTWPQAGLLLGKGGGDIALHSMAKPPPGQTPGQPSALNLSRFLGGGAGSPGAGVARPERGGTRGIGKLTLPGGTGEVPGGSGGSGGEPEGAQQPPPASDQPQGVVGKAVSGVGNTVQKDTQSLGDTVNSQTGTNLGSVVTGLGDTLNKNLQALAGNG